MLFYLFWIFEKKNVSLKFLPIVAAGEGKKTIIYNPMFPVNLKLNFTHIGVGKLISVENKTENKFLFLI